jgi:hypothetical protein
MPAVKRRTTKFNSVVELLWSVPTDEEDEEGVSFVEYGWVVKLTNEDYVQVNQREFFHWLAGVARDQIDMQAFGDLSIRSPLSQRKHVPKLGRTRWKVYRHLLAEVNALEKINGNIVALKDSALRDPWQVIKAIEAVRPLQEL